MEIRIANYSEKNAILDFINENWQENHIFVRWPQLFDDYHKNGKKLNYMIAINEGKIYGICGFIYANHEEQPDVWVALWKVIPSGMPGLGMNIIDSLRRTLNCNVLSCCGIRKEVKKIYEFLGFKTGTLKHFYRLNGNCDYRIAIVFNNLLPNSRVLDDVELVPIENESEFKNMVRYESDAFQIAVPWKDCDYVIRKYFHNIAYKHLVFTIKMNGGLADAVLVTKIVEANGGRALRIVDFLGDEKKLQLCGKELDRLMNDYNCEYIDIYEYGLSDSVLQNMGMKELDENDKNIIPNYFEPFEQKNVDIHFFTSQMENFRMFKADGDQERPNIVYGESK